MTAFERLIAAVEGHGLIVKDTGRGRVSAQCPAHDDAAPSLSITGIETQALVHCHAGCATADVLAALDLKMADLFDVGGGAEYRYNDGRRVTRMVDPATGKKSFRQSGKTKAQPGRAFLYRVDKVMDAVAAGRPVFVAEGEKDVHALEAAGVVATTNPMGAGNWSKVNPEPLYGGNVLVVADQDDAGQRWAGEVVESLVGRVEKIAVFAPRVGKDAADHIAAGYGIDDLLAVESPKIISATSSVPLPAGDIEETGKKSAASVLVDLALADHEIGVSIEGETFGVPREGPRLVRPLRGGKVGLRAELARRFRETTGKVASQQALADALLALEGEAQLAEPTELALRVAETSDGDLWLDLGDTTGAAVRVTDAGWSIESAAPVLFRRTVLTGALPQPERGDHLGQLWALLNVAEADRPLIAAWLVSLLYPRIPHPIPALLAEQGTGKTTAAKMLTGLLDPSPVQVRKAPRDSDSWVTAASGSWVVAIDNLSDVNDWLSDTLCRAVTGDGDVRRRLYSDGELSVFSFRRCVLLTGIDLGALRGDLADRLLPVELNVIGERQRRLDADLERGWRASHAGILGSVLDLAARVKAVLPSVELEAMPRMADYARLLAAVDQVLGTDGLRHYVTRAGTLAADALTADDFVTAMLTQLGGQFTGSAADLLSAVDHGDKRAPKGWPATPRAVTTLLRRQAPVMRRAGWTVTDLGADNKQHVTRWDVITPEVGRERTSPTSPNSPRGEVASLASHRNGQSQDGRGSCPTCSRPSRPGADGSPAQCLACITADVEASRKRATS